MSRKRTSANSESKHGDKTPIYVAAIGLISTLITALFGYLNIRTQLELPISITQTAEARFAKTASVTTAIPITLVPTPFGVAIWTPTFTPLSPTPTSISTQMYISPTQESVKTITAETAQNIVEILRYGENILFEPNYGLKIMDFSPDSQHLAVASCLGVSLYEAKTMETVWIKELPPCTISVTFSPDGKTLASTSTEKELYLWSVDGTLLSVLKGHNDQVRNAAFSPDGSLVASSSWDGTTRVWQVSDGSLLKTLEKSVDKLEFSPDGSLLATTVGDAIRLWRTSDWTLVGLLQKAGVQNLFTDMAFSPDGKLIASQGDELILWDVNGRNILRNLGATPEIGYIAFSPDGSILASSQQKVIRLIRVTDGQILQNLQGHTEGVWGLEFSPDGTVLVSAGFNEKILYWGIKP
jgi:dipeptidyl aminopeptidase/acylaminoacyl peptidase